MSTARNRFGVSILVAVFFAILLNAAPAHAASEGDSLFGAFASIGTVATATSSRMQAAVVLGATVPLLVAAVMVRRRIYADADCLRHEQ